MTDESTRITTGVPSEPASTSDTITAEDLHAEFEELQDETEDLADNLTKRLIVAGLSAMISVVLIKWLLGRRSAKAEASVQTTVHPLDSGTLDLLGTDMRGLGALIGKRIARKSLFSLVGKSIGAAIAAGAASFLFGNKSDNG